MNADGFMRALEKQGETVTLRRLTGTQRVPFSVKCRAFVQTGAEQMLIGGVQQTVDVVKLTDRELKAARWPGPPRHGDQCIYADGRTTTIQGRADTNTLGEDQAYFLKTFGG